YLHAIAERTEHADEGVAESGIPEVTDVCRLVRIDVGVLDNNLFTRCRRGDSVAPQQSRGICAPIEANVDVSVAGDLHGRYARYGPDFFGQFGGDFPGRLA